LFFVLETFVVSQEILQKKRKEKKKEKKRKEKEKEKGFLIIKKEREKKFMIPPRSEDDLMI